MGALTDEGDLGDAKALPPALERCADGILAKS